MNFKCGRILNQGALNVSFTIFAPLCRIQTPECFEVMGDSITTELCIQELKGIEDFCRGFIIQIFERRVLFMLLTVKIIGH
jgi:hypothetical protein